MIEVQGHRGSKGTHKENTLSAFQEAMDAGCSVVELDLRITKDKEIIIYHDPSIENEMISSLTTRELKKKDQDVITLKELFQFFKKKIGYNLEIKFDQSCVSREDLVKKVLDLVEENDLKKQVFYSSFDEKVLFELQKLEKNAKIGFLNEKSLDKLYDIGSSLGATVLSPDHRLLKKKEDVKRLQKKGALVVPWTVDQLKRLQELVNMGVDGIITNYPRKFIEYLECV